MPNKYHHQVITRQALKSAGVNDARLLIEEYSSFPDNFHRDYDNIAPYMFIMDKVEFHYPPHTPVDQFYRYWDHIPHQKTVMLDWTENHNHRIAESGFRFYMEHCVNALREGKREEAWKFLGCLLHFLEDHPLILPWKCLLSIPCMFHKQVLNICACLCLLDSLYRFFHF